MKMTDKKLVNGELVDLTPEDIAQREKDYQDFLVQQNRPPSLEERVANIKKNLLTYHVTTLGENPYMVRFFFSFANELDLALTTAYNLTSQGLQEGLNIDYCMWLVMETLPKWEVWTEEKYNSVKMELIGILQS